MYHICCDEKDVGEAELPSIPMIHNRWAGRHVASSLVKFAGSSYRVDTGECVVRVFWVVTQRFSSTNGGDALRDDPNYFSCGED